MDISKDIKESIEKNLPQAVGETLQARLKEADDDRAALAAASVRINALTGSCHEANNNLSAARAELDKHAALAEREAAVAERERNAENAALKTQLAAAERNTEFARSVAMGLVRNIEYRHSVHRTESGNIPVSGAGGYPSSHPTNSSVTEDTTQGAN